jgi:hypothetical protein
VECKDFDAQVARPKGKLKSLQKKFIRLRIVDMKNVDIGLFHFDFDTTFAIFIRNHNEQIYLRYGSHDDKSAYSFLSIKSLNHALEQGLKLHKDWRSGKLKFPERPKKKLIQSYPRVQKVEQSGNCVRCHYVAQSEYDERLKTRNFDKKRHLWVYPDPAKFGIELDANTGTSVKKAQDAASKAGLKRSDVIQKVGERAVYTFTDIQYALHKMPGDARQLTLTVLRKKTQKTVTIALPQHWRVTNLVKRSWGYMITPFPGFWAKSLPASQKRRMGLKKNGFASVLTKFWTRTNGQKAGLRAGDVIYDIDGVLESPIAANVLQYIRLHCQAGDTIRVKALRGRKKLSFSFKLKANRGR